MSAGDKGSTCTGEQSGVSRPLVSHNLSSPLPEPKRPVSLFEFACHPASGQVFLVWRTACPARRLLASPPLRVFATEST